MPLYEYENKKTGEKFTEHLPISKRNNPCRSPFIRRVLSAPKISVLSDMGGKEDKIRETILQSAERGYEQREKAKTNKTPAWSKEKREKSKQKRRWL